MCLKFIFNNYLSCDMTKPAKCMCPSEDSDQHGHLPSLIRVSAVHSMGKYGHKLSSFGQPRL